jgi:hypothetical protein
MKDWPHRRASGAGCPAAAGRSERLVLRTIVIAMGVLTAAVPSTPRAETNDTPLSVHVKFRPGTAIATPEHLLPVPLKDSVASMTPLFTLSDKELDRVGAGELKLWFKLTLKPGTDRGRFIEELKHLDDVEVAEPAPRPAPPP